MLILLENPINEQQLKQVSEDLDGYIKFVVDLEQDVLVAGGLRHVDAEQLLVKNGSKQSNLWGGGWDSETDQVDYDSMINIRPNQGNLSREVLSEEIRAQILKIVNKLLRKI